MRTVDTHLTAAAGDRLQLIASDTPGCAGASHRYLVRGMDTHSNPSRNIGEEPATGLVVLFQNGPIAEAGINGVTHEVLLAIVADRLRSFQAGPYACEENAQALVHTEAALAWLKRRTEQRQARGVEGTSAV